MHIVIMNGDKSTEMNISAQDENVYVIPEMFEGRVVAGFILRDIKVPDNNGNYRYQCYCQKCNSEQMLTVQEMVNHYIYFHKTY